MNLEKQRPWIRNAWWMASALCFLALLVYRWGRFADPQVDFGREAVLPWEILRGHHPYRNFDFFNGPLSAYFNAGVFKIFGVGLNRLFLVNAVIAAVATAILARLLSWMFSAEEAGVATLAFVLMFPFAQLERWSIFNWIAPYSHEPVHGLVLGLVCLLAFHLAVSNPLKKTRWLILAGLAFGAGFLTKAEVWIGSIGVVVCYLPTMKGRHAWFFWASVAAVLLVAAGLLWPLVGFARLPMVLLGGWPYDLSFDWLITTPFYLGIAGVSSVDPMMGGRWIWGIGMWVLCGLLVWILSKLSRIRPSARHFAWPLALLSLLWIRYMKTDIEVFLFLPPLAFGFILTQWKSDPSPIVRLQQAYVVFALIVALKIVFAFRTHDYGFVHAAPLVVYGIASLWERFPRWLAQKFELDVRTILVFTRVLVFAVLTNHLASTIAWQLPKKNQVGEGADSFWTDERGLSVEAVRRELLRSTRPGDRIAALPEGALIAYLVRRDLAGRSLNLMPLEFSLFGEHEIAAAIEADSPAYVLLLHRYTPEYGKAAFGKDYGMELWGWVQRNYLRAQLFGAEPYTGEDYGIALYRRNPVN